MLSLTRADLVLTSASLAPFPLHSLGDWLMSWAWCLPAGFSSPIPYYYVIFFAILLVHRQIRDDEACAHK